jgi:hypothetical protein
MQSRVNWPNDEIPAKGGEHAVYGADTKEKLPPHEDCVKRTVQGLRGDEPSPLPTAAEMRVPAKIKTTPASEDRRKPTA